MATAQTTPVTKTDQVDDFTANVRNLITSSTVWYTGSPSLPANMIGFPTSYLGGGQNPGGPSTADLSNAAITATVLAGAFQTWCKNYTRVRRFRFVRTGNLAPYDQTQQTHMNSTFMQPVAYVDIDSTATANNVATGATVAASNFNSFVSQLYSKWNGYKNNTITYTYNYCHSNCHSSCHSSTRWRR